MNVERREPDHTYWRGQERLWSVTQILQQMGCMRDLSFLDPFYRQRGSAVHACIDILLQGLEVDWDFEGAEDVRPRVEKWQRLAESARLRAIVHERPLGSLLHGYAGTPDYLGSWGRYPLAIVDWKGDTTEPGQELQIAGYRGLLHEAATNKLIDVDPQEVLVCPAFIVPLGPTTSPREIPSAQAVPDLQTFLGLARGWNWRVARLGAGNDC